VQPTNTPAAPATKSATDKDLPAAQAAVAGTQ
jgi:hypothetical protein